MRLVSWNVNGLRACAGKGFRESVESLNADVISLQEIKLQAGQFDLELPGYAQYYRYAEKKGYSGTAVLTRVTPLRVENALLGHEFDNEGRVLVCDFGAFTLVNCYTPNAQRELTRLAPRLVWEDQFRDWLRAMDDQKPVVLCGDLNVAHQEIDLRHPKPNIGHAGFTDEERGKFSALLEAGFTDSFRYLHPDARDAYSWWSFIRNARASNAGWRIDYFVVSNRLRDRIRGAAIHPDIYGSDHCPVSLDLDID